MGSKPSLELERSRLNLILWALIHAPWDGEEEARDSGTLNAPWLLPSVSDWQRCQSGGVVFPRHMGEYNTAGTRGAGGAGKNTLGS